LVDNVSDGGSKILETALAILFTGFSFYSYAVGTLFGCLLLLAFNGQSEKLQKQTISENDAIL